MSSSRNVPHSGDGLKLTIGGIDHAVRIVAPAPGQADREVRLTEPEGTTRTIQITEEEQYCDCGGHPNRCRHIRALRAEGLLDALRPAPLPPLPGGYSLDQLCERNAWSIGYTPEDLDSTPMYERGALSAGGRL
jgi:hypothetical protein